MEIPGITKPKPIQGVIQVPGDKSITHRAIILGAIAEGETRVQGFLAAEDCLRTIAAFEAMGVRFDREGKTLRIYGKGYGALQEPRDILDMGNSGTGIRLIAGILAGREFFSVLTGDRSLRRRPMRRVVEPLRQMGAIISGRADGQRCPLAIQGRPLNAIDYHLPMPSAQVKSAVLLAGLNAEGKTSVHEPIQSRDHSERLLKYFGVELEEQNRCVSVQGPVVLQGREVPVPGDLSSAAFMIVAALIVRGSELQITNVGVNQTRTGILEILLEMGADIKVENHREVCGEPVADFTIRSSALKGTIIQGERTLRSLDEFPILCVAAAAASGETIFSDVNELRVKETDRISVMISELSKMGVHLKEFKNGVKVMGKGRLQGAVCDSHSDHRVALALTVAGLIAKGETVVKNTECAEVSFPGFYSLLNSLQTG